jgi:hypothetical protein
MLIGYNAKMLRQRSRVWGAVLFILILLAPIVSYRAAFRSYFDSDDFGTINWARFVTFRGLLRDIPNLIYPNGRPVGYFYYLSMLDMAGLNFPAWAVLLAILGAVNLALVWWLLRKFAFGEIETALGCLFFGMNGALFDAWWRPAFIYDVLATTFALLAILAYLNRWWVASFLASWLSLRAKEIGIVVPAVLLCYEMTAGKRSWKRVLPFFIPAIIYGTSGVWFSLHAPRTPYTLQAGGVSRTIVFYASKLFGLRYAAFALLMPFFFLRDPRYLFALAGMACEIAIYLFLPDRTLPVYLYLAATSTAIAIAAMTARYRRVMVAAVLLWSAWQYTLIRKQARVMIADAEDRRAYAAAVESAPDAPVYAYADAPVSFDNYGGEYVIRHFHKAGAVYRIDDSALPANTSITLLDWNAQTRRLSAAAFQADRNRFLERGHAIAAWPVDAEGYRPLEKTFRLWMYRPNDSPAESVEACGEAGSQLRAWFDDDPLTLDFDHRMCIAKSKSVPAPDARMVVVRFAVASGEVKVGAFGFHLKQESVSR